MSVLDVLAWVFIALGTVTTVYNVAMLATGPARARWAGGAHAPAEPS
jgi:alkylated DNA nucleotide flippase Atl1